MLFSPVKKTIIKLLEGSKGILAADETPNTIGKRFDKLGIENSEENRRSYREMLFTTANLSNYISGVILQDETIRQKTKDGRPFTEVLQNQGIVVGIKVDKGLEPFNGTEEKVTQGLDGLEERLISYYKMGARFAKWRAIVFVSEKTPTLKNMEENAVIFAQYANLCLRNGLVPIVEPEVITDGKHDIEKDYIVTKKFLLTVFEALQKNKINLKQILLKPNMVMPGSEGSRVLPEVIADKTIACFKEAVPEQVPGIVFLSGGQSEEEACINLNAIATYGKNSPWKFGFSFGRALQNSAMLIWKGDEINNEAAQTMLIRRSAAAAAARSGTYGTI